MSGLFALRAPGSEPIRCGLAAAFLSLVVSTAPAQRLNLDTPGKPPPGSGTATLELADAIDRELVRIGTSSRALDRARVSLRAVARDLLRTGERLGESGHVQVLMGRTMATRLADFDALIGESTAGHTEAPDRPELLWLAKDLSIPADSFGEVRTMDRLLRDAFAPWATSIDVLHFLRAWEWGLAEAPPPSLSERARRAGLSPGAAELFAALDSLVASGFASLPYRPVALALHLDTADALDLLSRKPQPLPQSAAERFRVTLIEAAGALADPAGTPESLDAARARLRTLALTARLIAATLAADPQAAARSVLARIAESVLSPDFADDAESPVRLLACIRATDLCAFPDRIENESRLPRQFRPAHRVLLQGAKQSASRLVEVLPRVLHAGGSPLDPAVVGALNAHGSRVRALAALRHAGLVTAEDAGDDPAVKPEYRTVADRVLALGQDLGKANRRELALAELAVLVRDLSNSKAVESTALEAPLGAPASPEWTEIYNRAVTAIGDTRKRWLSEHSQSKPPADGATGEQLEALVRCLNLVSHASHGAAMLEGARRGDAEAAALQSLPGFELATPALEAIMAGLLEACAPAVDSAVRGDASSSLQLVERAEQSHAPALLVGSLVLGADPGSRAPGTAADFAVMQVVAGTPDPDRAPSAGARESIAGMCRYAEEWAAAIARKDSGAAEMFKAATISEAVSARARRERWLDHERLLGRVD